MKTETVSWYCHSCGRTHKHTPDQRDAHRDDLRRREMYLIDARKTGEPCDHVPSFPNPGECVRCLRRIPL